MSENTIEFKAAFDLVSKIVQNGEGEYFLSEIAVLNKIITTDLPEAMKDNAPSNFSELYANFKYTFEKFKDFILFDKLIGKNTVALGGGFSTGKSSFINAILNEKLLPSEIDPTTSVPTYVISGKKNSAMGINVFNKKIDLDIDDVKIISHGFSSEYNVKFGHLLETIFIETPSNPYKAISFLDTPGYSKPESETYSLKTDENIARTQLNSANYILWFVSAEEGTISEEDIKFIKNLNSEIPLAIILNKSDKKTDSDVEQVVSQIIKTVEQKGIFPIDVIPFSCRYPQKYGLKKIQKLFNDWNEHDYISTFARDFKILFVKCRQYFEEQIRNETRRLNWINTGQTFSDVPEVEQAFTNLSNEIKIFIQNYRQKEKHLIELQKEFFTEIKKVGDKYKIELPEPSEIELISNKTSTLNAIIRKLKEKKGIKSSENIHILKKHLSGAENNLINSLGNINYSKTVGNIILSNLSKEPIKVSQKKEMSRIIKTSLKMAIRNKPVIPNFLKRGAESNDRKKN